MVSCFPELSSCSNFTSSDRRSLFSLQVTLYCTITIYCYRRLSHSTVRRQSVGAYLLPKNVMVVPIATNPRKAAISGCHPKTPKASTCKPTRAYTTSRPNTSKERARRVTAIWGSRATHSSAAPSVSRLCAWSVSNTYGITTRLGGLALQPQHHAQLASRH